jgi:glycosyltransferase involved in cell wall biosynthesis
MSAEAKPSFAFLVLTFNHQDYILEHLESIKYLVHTHGSGWDIDLIVNDDASRDQTCSLVDRWLTIHSTNFRHVKTIYNAKNLGTCASVNNVLSYLVADRCKLTAGDDVYSFENIFELTAYAGDTAMVSGRALYLLGDELRVDRLANILTTATQAIYDHNSLLHRFKHLSYNNAPNLLYATECLMNPRVREFLLRFDVVEDWPLQVAIAREYPKHRLALIDQVLVYYRRTPGSTYIVANQRFVKDKLQLYTDLIQNEASAWERLRLKSRRYCFKLQNRWANKLLNLDWYIYLASCISNLYNIFQRENRLNFHSEKHRKHYARVRLAALQFLSSR